MEKTTIFTCDSIGVSGTTPVQKGREIKARESRALAAEHELTKLQTEVEQLQAELKYMTTQRNVWLTDEQSRCRDVAILQKENQRLKKRVTESERDHHKSIDQLEVEKERNSTFEAHTLNAIHDADRLQKENDELTMAVAEYTAMHEALKDEMQVSKRLEAERDGIRDELHSWIADNKRLQVEAEQALKEGESDD